MGGAAPIGSARLLKSYPPCALLYRSDLPDSFPPDCLLFSFCRDAAALACVCATSANAAPSTKWPRKVRIGRGGAVLEPASGAFDVTVAPGEDVQAAVKRCPPGGCVMLLPGPHEGPLVLGLEVNVRRYINGVGGGYL